MTDAVPDWTDPAFVASLPPGDLSAPLSRKPNGRHGPDGVGDAAKRPERPPLPLIYAADIEPCLDTNDFVQDTLIEGSAAMAFGPSGGGKTFAIIDLGLHVAAGMRWHGRRVEQGGVIHCAMEGGAGFRNRVVAWRRHHGMEDVVLPFAAIMSSLDLLDPEADTPRLIDAIKAASATIEMPVKMVIIDTLSRALAGGDENGPGDMGALVKNIDAIREATGVCVLAVHHSGKDATRGARGHSLLHAALDTELEISVDAETGVRTLSCTKQREMAKAPPVSFTLTTVTLGENHYHEPVTSCVVEPAEAGLLPREGRDLTPRQNGWFRDITDLFASADAVLRTPIAGMKPILTLTRQQVRDGLRAKGRFEAEPHAPLTPKDRTALKDALNSLKDKGKLGLSEEHVWLT